MRSESTPNPRRGRATSGDRCRGYVLLTVVAVLVLLVTVLSRLASTSLQRALAAADAQVRLQQRLGADSIESVVLPRAAKVFDQRQESIPAGDTQPIGTLRSALTLGGVTCDLLLADEDAKLDLNQVYHAVGRQRTESILGKQLGPAAARSIRLRPATGSLGWDRLADAGDDGDPDAVGPSIPRAFRAWGDVLDTARLMQTFGTDAALPNVTSEMTCWGGGGLNVRRASQSSIGAAAACVLPEAAADGMARRLKENPDLSLEILITQEANTERRRMRLRQMLSETSSHFSLWLDASSPTRRSFRTFSVLRRGDDGDVHHERFAF